MLRFLYIIILTIVGFFLQSCMVSQNKVHTDFFDNPIQEQLNFCEYQCSDFLSEILRETGFERRRRKPGSD